MQIFGTDDLYLCGPNKFLSDPSSCSALLSVRDQMNARGTGAPGPWDR